MKFAVIDLGTNTFSLLIAEAVSGKLYPLHRANEYVKIGGQGISRGCLAPEAMERGVAALRKFVDVLQTYKVEDVKIIATSAIRSAQNKGEFLSMVKEQLNLDIEVIDGGQEASYIYKGVEAASRRFKAPYLIMDIGGGSVEFIIVHKSKILWKESYEIGVQRLFNQFHATDPLTVTQSTALKSYIDQQLLSLKHAIRTYKPQILVGAASTFSTLSLMITAQTDIEYSYAQPFFKIELEEFDEVVDYMKTHTYEERQLRPGMPKKKADMIIEGLALIQHVIKTAGFTDVFASKYALCEGVFFELYENNLSV